MNLQIKYPDVPRYYTWNQTAKRWDRRKRGAAVEGHPGVMRSDALRRVYTVHPNNHECFFLWMLLHEVTGPTSFDGLCILDGLVCNSFREACSRRGLLEDDTQWRQAMQEAVISRSPQMIRLLFAIIIVTCQVSEPVYLWQQFNDEMAEDILYEYKQAMRNMNLSYTGAVYNRALIKVEDLVYCMGGRNMQSYGFGHARQTKLSTVTNRICP